MTQVYCMLCSVYIISIVCSVTCESFDVELVTSSQQEQCKCKTAVDAVDCSALNVSNSDLPQKTKCSFDFSKIDLSHNALHSFSDNLSSFVEISLARNELTIINTTEKQKVIVLNVNSNQIRQINLENNFENLRYLQASHNRLGNESVFIEGQCNIIALFVSNNLLTSLLDVTMCAQLVTLDASHNEISSIPYNMTILKNLTRLYLSHNTFTNIYNLPSELEILDLSHNKLETVPDIRQVTQLRTLLLSNNKIASVCQNMEMPLRTLTFIDLSKNEIEAVDDSFNWTFRAREINLSNNCIINVSETVLQQWKLLEKLDLSSNNLSVLPILPQMWELKVISLANNDIQILTFEEADALLSWGSAKRFVDLRGNFQRIETSEVENLVRRIGTSDVMFSGTQCSCMEITRNQAVLSFCVSNPLNSDGLHWFLNTANLTKTNSVSELCSVVETPQQTQDVQPTHNFSLIILLLTLALLLGVISLFAAIWSIHTTLRKKEGIKVFAEFSKPSRRGFDHMQCMRRSRSVDWL